MTTEQICDPQPDRAESGAIGPHERAVLKAAIFENKAAGTLIADVRFADGSSAALMWPLGNGWTAAPAAADG